MQAWFLPITGLFKDVTSHMQWPWVKHPTAENAWGWHSKEVGESKPCFFPICVWLLFCVCCHTWGTTQTKILWKVTFTPVGHDRQVPDSQRVLAKWAAVFTTLLPVSAWVSVVVSKYADLGTCVCVCVCVCVSKNKWILQNLKQIQSIRLVPRALFQLSRAAVWFTVLSLAHTFVWSEPHNFLVWISNFQTRHWPCPSRTILVHKLSHCAPFRCQEKNLAWGQNRVQRFCWSCCNLLSELQSQQLQGLPRDKGKIDKFNPWCCFLCVCIAGVEAIFFWITDSAFCVERWTSWWCQTRSWRHCLCRLWIQRKGLRKGKQKINENGRTHVP